MTTHHEPASAVQTMTVGVLGNLGAWGLQDSATLFAMLLSIVTTVWVILQMLRFIQKWRREDEEWAELKAKRAREKLRSRQISPGALGD